MYRLLNKKPLILFYAENKIYFQKLLIYEVSCFFFKQIKMRTTCTCILQNIFNSVVFVVIIYTSWYGVQGPVFMFIKGISRYF